MKKNLCTPINPKKISMLRPKKKLYKEFDNEKKFLRFVPKLELPFDIFVMVTGLSGVQFGL